METTVETSSYILGLIDNVFLLRYFINLVLLIEKLVPEKYTTITTCRMKNIIANAMAKNEIFQIVHKCQLCATL